MQFNAGEREAVVATARDLVRAAMSARPRWSPPPFDPRILAEHLGIPISSQRDFPDLDAFLVFPDGSPHIFVNAGIRSQGRVTFSIAHEIAHTFFPRRARDRYHFRSGHKDVDYPTDEARRLERLCDLVAAELIMPLPWFAESLGEAGLRASAIRRLSEIYGVSLEAAALRITETAGSPCAAGLFELAAQPSCGQGRSASRRVSYRARRVFHGRGFPYLFPPGKSVPDTSVLQRASLKTGERSAVEKFALGRASAHVKVSAYPLHRGQTVEEPPTVCALFVLA